MSLDDSRFSIIEIDVDGLSRKGISNVSEIATHVEYIPLETMRAYLVIKSASRDEGQGNMDEYPMLRWI
jgi:hypothetical protein